MIERRLGLPCVGVVPYLHDLGLDGRTAVTIETRRTVRRSWDPYRRHVAHRPLRIGVIALPTCPILRTLMCWSRGAIGALARGAADDAGLADV